MVFVQSIFPSSVCGLLKMSPSNPSTPQGNTQAKATKEADVWCHRYSLFFYAQLPLLEFPWRVFKPEPPDLR